MTDPTDNPGAAVDRRLTLEDLLPPLVKSGLVLESDARELRILHQSTQSVRNEKHPLVWLSERQLSNPNGAGMLTLEVLTQWMAKHLGLPYYHIDPLKIDADSVTRVISIAYATRYRILPVLVTSDSVTFATAEPYERSWEHELSHVLQRRILRVIANPLDLVRYQEELFGLSHSIRKAGMADDWRALSGVTNVEALVELGKSGKLDANDRHIITIVDWLFQYAFEQRASDIHLEPRRDVGNMRFRIDGMLHNVYQVPAAIMVAITSRIKSLGRMDIVEKRRPQDGRVKTRTPAGLEVELRLSTMPTAFGEKLVMRIFDPQVLVRSPAELGFSKSDAKQWQAMTAQTHGIILVTGPTGSGKTTTLYTTLKALAGPEVNVCTIEDPIEMVEPTFNQMQVNAAVDLDFAAGVRTLMRQDPDIVMVGEIRDLETAEMAIQAALTGHLVFASLHTNDAASAVMRLTDLGVPPYLIGATLIGVVAQRLVRTLCPHCKAEIESPDRASWRGLTHPWKVSLPGTIYQANGCDSCRGTGYQGRLGIYEILQMSQEIREQVASGAPIEQINRQGVKQGMEPLRLSGVRKVVQGLTSMDEVLRVTPAAQLGSAG